MLLLFISPIAKYNSICWFIALRGESKATKRACTVQKVKSLQCCMHVPPQNVKKPELFDCLTGWGLGISKLKVVSCLFDFNGKHTHTQARGHERRKFLFLCWPAAWNGVSNEPYANVYIGMDGLECGLDSGASVNMQAAHNDGSIFLCFASPSTSAHPNPCGKAKKF